MYTRAKSGMKMVFVALALDVLALILHLANIYIRINWRLCVPASLLPVVVSGIVAFIGLFNARGESKAYGIAAKCIILAGVLGAIYAGLGLVDILGPMLRWPLGFLFIGIVYCVAKYISIGCQEIDSRFELEAKKVRCLALVLMIIEVGVNVIEWPTMVVTTVNIIALFVALAFAFFLFSLVANIAAAKESRVAFK